MTEFKHAVEIMRAENSITEDMAARILRIYESSLDELAGELRTKVQEWELLDPEDAKLYSLGLRHSIDILEVEKEKIRG